MRLSDCPVGGQPMFSTLSRVKELEAQGRDIVNLCIGDPDFDAPEAAVKAMLNSLANGGGHYCPSTGVPEFKEKAQEATLRSRGFKPSMDQLLPTAGVNPQLWYVAKCTCNPGDEAIIPCPGFPTYRSVLELEGVVPIPVRLRASSGFQMEPEDIEKAITPRTKLLIVNSPSNPCGSIMDEDRWRAIYDICAKWGLWLLADETYARIVYSDTPFFSPSSIDSCRDRVVLCNGLSKSYAMTGWRIGMVTAPAFLTAKMALLLETTSSCVSPFIQMAGAAVLGSEDKEMLEEYRRRRDCLVEGLRGIDVISTTGKYVPAFCVREPQGAFYVWVRPYPGLRKLDLLNGCGVAVADGSMFGDAGEGYIRFSFANNPVPRLQEAVDRIKEYLE